MGQATAIISVSSAGSAKHIPYICRPEAVSADPCRESRQRQERELGRAAEATDLGAREYTKSLAPNAARPEEVKTSPHERLSEEQSIERLTHSADAIWTWNAPSYVTGDVHGTHGETKAPKRFIRGQSPKIVYEGGVRASTPQQLTLKEKIGNACAYFGLLSDVERKKGGVNSYRAVLTVKREISDEEMRGAVNHFLRENFPRAQALAALHRNTSHVHVHLYVHSRQPDGRKVNLGQAYFRLDESWAKVCSEHFKDRAIYDEHMRLKNETKKWKRRRVQAQAQGQNIPPKGMRWADNYEVKHGVVRPWDDHWVGRLKAVARVAETKAEYLRVTNTPGSQTIEAKREAQKLQQKLQLVATRRLNARSVAKREMPAEIITLKEQKELARYSQTIHEATARLQGTVSNQLLPLQAEFDFTKSPASQIAFDFYAPAAGKVLDRQADDDRKLRPMSGSKPKTLEPLPHAKVVGKLALQKERPPQINIWQREPREKKLSDAHTAAITGLRQISQKGGIIFDVQEFAESQSANLRQEIQEKYGLSVHDLGYTRQNWATLVLNRVEEALRRESVNHLIFAAAQAEREMSSIRRAVEEGEERALTALAGEEPRSRASGATDHRPSFNRAGKNRSIQGRDKAGERLTITTHQDQSAREQIFERTDRLEHFFSR